MARTAIIKRKTNETSISLDLNLDGEGRFNINTGIGFFNHMLGHFSYQSCIDLNIHAVGDLEVDPHHTVEDVGIILGQSIKEALGDKCGISRYGESFVPMDDALVLAVIDLSGRSFLDFNIPLGLGKVGEQFDLELAKEFFLALSRSGITIHFQMMAGQNRHHILEAAFKAFGRAMRQAIAMDSKRIGIPSTKGILSEE